MWLTPCSRCSMQRVDLECNLIGINETDWVYPLGLATSPSDSVSHSENAAVKATSHLMIFDIPMRPVRDDQIGDSYRLIASLAQLGNVWPE